MSYATLMVHLNQAAEGAGNESRLAIAADLARRFKAHVIGVAACDPQPSPYFFGAYGDQVLGEERVRVERELAELSTPFLAAMQGRALSADWRAALAPPARYVTEQARAADLVIVGAQPEGGLADPMRELDVADLVMRAGRPVLVVPAGATPLRFDAAVVGWKGTREARRAIRDALPLLCLHRQTIVAAFVEDEDGDEPRCRRAANDVAGWLAHHGVNAQTMVMPDFGDAARQLEAVASERGADIVVAGAYGHSRFSEWVFGGVTRSLLKRSPRCLLLAH